VHRWHRIDDLHARAVHLQQVARDVLEEVGGQLAAAMGGLVKPPAVTSGARSPEQVASIFDLVHNGQAESVASQLGYRANVKAETWWARLQIPHAPEAMIVVVLHHVGPREEGSMAATAFMLQAATRGQALTAPPEALAEATFFFSQEDVRDREDQEFESWLRPTIRKGLSVWRQSL
jgi:hypothetical protein